MPNDSSNFTIPDVGGGGPTGGATRGTGDNGQVWNPSGGPDGKGAWEAPSQHAPPRRTFVSGEWGGQGESVDGNGNPIAGTSGAAQDRNRFRLMGQTPTNYVGPQIDQTQSNEARGIGMGALGLLGQTAAGSSPSVAERLGTAQGQAAQNSRFGIAASVRGGATARAAAGRGAVQDAGTIGQQTLSSNAATRADEMARAREAYFGAASAQRGTDLGVANSQADLNEGQNALNDQRENANEQLGYDVSAANLQHKMGHTAEQANAANAAHATAVAGQQQDYANTRQNWSAATGTAQGAAQAYAQTQSGEDSGKPDPDADTGSDENEKTNIRPVFGKEDTDLAMRPPSKPISDRAAKRLEAEAKGMQDQTSAQRMGLLKSGRGGPSPISDRTARSLEAQAKDMQAQTSAQRAGLLKGDRPKMDPTNPYDASYHGDMFAGPAGTPHSLSEAIETAHRNDTFGRSAIPDRMRASSSGADPYNATLFGGGQRGYAKSRAGQAGSFGGPKADYSHQLWGDEAPGRRPLAPGSGDYYAATGDHSIFGTGPDTTDRVGEKFSRSIMVSDARAKDDAYQLGVRQGLAYKGPKLDSGEIPDEMEGDRTHHNGFVGGRAAGSTGKRVPRSEARAEAESYRTPQVWMEPTWLERGADEAEDAIRERFGTPPRAAPAPVPTPNGGPPRGEPTAPLVSSPPPLGQLGSQARTMVSDEKTKSGEQRFGENEMAQANRSMAPFEYEYKPGFAEREGQRVGDKNIGPIAQNMEANPVAKTVILKDPETGLLAIDKTKALKLTMGGLSSLQRQVDRLERRRA